METRHQSQRDAITSEYEVSEHGIITSPGKFEAEMIYVPYYYDLIGDGASEIIDGPLETRFDVFEIDADDRALWPEIDETTTHLVISERDNGFVDCEEMTSREFERWSERIARDVEEEMQAQDEEMSEPEEITQYRAMMHAYCGMSYAIMEWTDDEAFVRREVAHYLKRKRHHFHVATLSTGKEWEIETPENAVMVGDSEGTLNIQTRTVTR